jgi:hypothetical protein
VGLSLLHGFNCKGYCSPSRSTDLTYAVTPIPLAAKDKSDAGNPVRHALCLNSGLLLRTTVLRPLSHAARMLRMRTVLLWAAVLLLSAVLPNAGTVHADMGSACVRPASRAMVSLRGVSGSTSERSIAPNRSSRRPVSGRLQAPDLRRPTRAAAVLRLKRNTVWANAVLSGLPPAANAGPGDSVNKVFNDSVDSVWKLLHNAICNEMYHQDMLAKRTKEDHDARVRAALILVLGLAIGFVPALTRSWERWRIFREFVLYLGAVGFAAWGGVEFVAETGTMATEHRVLKSQWVAVKSELEDARSSLRQLQSTDPVPAEILGRIRALRRQEAALVATETDAIDTDAYNKAQGDANEILYTGGIRTAAQAKEYFKKQVEARQIPYRDPKPKAI